jgi:hypothetical protein
LGPVVVGSPKQRSRLARPDRQGSCWNRRWYRGRPVRSEGPPAARHHGAKWSHVRSPPSVCPHLPGADVHHRVHDRALRDPQNPQLPRGQRCTTVRPGGVALLAHSTRDVTPLASAMGGALRDAPAPHGVAPRVVRLPNPSAPTLWQPTRHGSNRHFDSAGSHVIVNQDEKEDSISPNLRF